MKVIFATDFYAASVTARALLMALRWSAATTLELLHVLAPPPRWGWFGRSVHAPQALEAARRELRSFGTDLAACVERTNGVVQHAIVVGDPATSIIDRASAARADLVVIGGPGRAESSTGQLSSLSATVVSHAPCSVLVARTSQVEHLVLDTEPSQAADLRGRIARWPLFQAAAAVASTPDAGSPDGDGVMRSLREGAVQRRRPRAIVRTVTGFQGSVLIARPRRQTNDAERGLGWNVSGARTR